MATRKTTPADEPNLLENMEDPAPETEDDFESYDLLEEITDDSGKAWYPWEDEEQPREIQVRVTNIGTCETDYPQKGEDPTRPLITGVDKEGDEWVFRGFHKLMKDEMDREIKKGLKNGDYIAFKYFGRYYHNAPAQKDRKKDEWPQGSYEKVKARSTAGR
jgi:hypothetical protein